MPAHRVPLEKRFWDRVEISAPDDCWIWPGSISGSGYGQIKSGAGCEIKTTSAHRVSFYLEHGYLPRVVMHTCDVRPCVNPAHLRGGTYSDNVADMLAKGRGADFRGERGSNSILINSQVLKIRERYNSGDSISDIAKDVDVGYRAVLKVCRNKSWTHLL